MSTSSLDEVRNQLQLDENADLRASIYAAFIDDSERGANMIVAFSAERGIQLETNDVIEYLQLLDDEDVDVELTIDMLASVSGGNKCA